MLEANFKRVMTYDDIIFFSYIIIVLKFLKIPSKSVYLKIFLNHFFIFLQKQNVIIIKD